MSVTNKKLKQNLLHTGQYSKGNNFKHPTHPDMKNTLNETLVPNHNFILPHLHFNNKVPTYVIIRPNTNLY